ATVKVSRFATVIRYFGNRLENRIYECTHLRCWQFQYRHGGEGREVACTRRDGDRRIVSHESRWKGCEPGGSGFATGRERNVRRLCRQRHLRASGLAAIPKGTDQDRLYRNKSESPIRCGTNQCGRARRELYRSCTWCQCPLEYCYGTTGVSSD